MTNKYICIHGHFYQPPRENPWLEAIELQDSAHPYPDWNRRITAECYAPNVASRILDSKGDIVDIINNYTKINFNFGPTLLSWLEREEPDIYLAILKADKSSQHFFNGHGSAMAQAYNHMIMPLANERDKNTQVLWGIKDFEFRFKRKPEGMWLPETAVDTPSLEVLAKHGIKYTVLAPHQAVAYRPLGSDKWVDLGGQQISSKKPFLCILPSGRKIALFFYEGPVSHDIAFSGLLNNGEALAARLLQNHNGNGPELTHVATDGETYGHHHRFGNMALSYCLHHIEENKLANITVLGDYLEKFPPQEEVKIRENSSWSCAHGVERWRADCGCCMGGNSWKQSWRQPLRESLNWLRDELAVVYEQEMNKMGLDAWKLRDEYIKVVSDRSASNIKLFLKQCVKQELSEAERVRLLKLLEMQRHAMFMFTSCGWFFDEVSGIETVQIMQYAARAVQLSREVSGKDLDPDFILKLEKAESNLSEYKNAKEIYVRLVKPKVIDLINVGAHFAISSLFEAYPETIRIYAYHVDVKFRKLHEVGKYRLFIGRAVIRSDVTWEKDEVEFVSIHLGDYNISAAVRFYQDEKAFQKMHDDLIEIFAENNITDVIQKMIQYFGDQIFNLWDLFKNEQGKVLEEVFESTLESIESSFRGVYDHYYPLMQIRPDFHIPLPKALAVSVEFVLNRDLLVEIQKKDMDFEKMERLVREMKRWNFTRDKEAINFAATEKLDYLMRRFTRYFRDDGLLHTICEFLKVCLILPLSLNVWRAQNIYFSMAMRLYPKVKVQADSGDEEAARWIKMFEQLSSYLKVHSP